MENKDTLINMGLVLAVIVFVLSMVYVIDLYTRTGHGPF
jgi:hypothetical protein